MYQENKPMNCFFVFVQKVPERTVPVCWVFFRARKVPNRFREYILCFEQCFLRTGGGPPGVLFYKRLLLFIFFLLF